MSFVKAGIDRIVDQDLKSALHERLDIVLHKIKFMDKVSVACLDTENKPNIVLRGVLEDAGGLLQENPAHAQVLIYHELGAGIAELMGVLPSLLQEEWPAVAYNRVYVMDKQVSDFADPETAVSTLEDIAELLYPGYFVFGNEGRTWAGFGL